MKGIKKLIYKFELQPEWKSYFESITCELTTFTNNIGGEILCGGLDRDPIYHVTESDCNANLELRFLRNDDYRPTYQILNKFKMYFMLFNHVVMTRPNQIVFFLLSVG